MMRALALALALLLAAIAPANAERLVSTLSNTSIQITSSFAGEVLTMFGNVEPNTGETDEVLKGPFHVVIVVEGPLADGVARRKRNVGGIWINTEQVTFENFPSYFQVLASGRLNTITNPTTLAVEDIDPASQARHSAVAGYWDSAVFGAALVRLMTERGHFGVSEDAVRFLSNSAYAARIVLPHDIPNGTFVARTYVFRNGGVIAERSEGFTVQKTGFERFLYSAAVGQPFLYGLVGVILAIFTGWLGGVVFRR
jgi:uncharacterized protein (TIGR02186 family)